MRPPGTFIQRGLQVRGWRAPLGFSVDRDENPGGHLGYRAIFGIMVGMCRSPLFKWSFFRWLKKNCWVSLGRNHEYHLKSDLDLARAIQR